MSSPERTRSTASWTARMVSTVQASKGPPARGRGVEHLRLERESVQGVGDLPVDRLDPRLLRLGLGRVEDRAGQVEREPLAAPGASRGPCPRRAGRGRGAAASTSIWDAWPRSLSPRTCETPDDPTRPGRRTPAIRITDLKMWCQPRRTLRPTRDAPAFCARRTPRRRGA